MTVPKNKPGSFRFSFPETIFSPGSPEISPDFFHFFPNNSVPIPISIARLTKNRPPYQPYSQQWPVSVTDACTSRRCQTPRRNTVKGHKSHTDNFFFIFSFLFIHLSCMFPEQLPFLPILSLFLLSLSVPAPFSGSAPSACFQAGISGSSCQMLL